MFTWKKSEITSLDETIEGLYTLLGAYEPHSEKYPKIVDQIVTLENLRNQIGSDKVSADVKATIIANLIGILVIVKHEQVGIVTSKALSFVTKLR